MIDYIFLAGYCFFAYYYMRRYRVLQGMQSKNAIWNLLASIVFMLIAIIKFFKIFY